MAQPHISKEELRHDAFQDSMHEGLEFLQKHLRYVIIGVVAVVVIVGAGIGYYAYLQRTAQQESAAFGAAEKILSAPGTATKEERIKQTATAVEGFLKEHPGSRLAPTAYIYLARFAFELKDYPTADANYQKALADSHLEPVQKAIVLLSLGKLRIAQGKPMEAQAFFDQVSDKRFEDAKAYAMGTANLAAGKADDARKQFQIAATAQPSSSITGWAKDALDFLP